MLKIDLFLERVSLLRHTRTLYIDNIPGRGQVPISTLQ